MILFRCLCIVHGGKVLSFLYLQGLWVTTRKEHDLTDQKWVLGEKITRDGDAWGWDEHYFYTNGKDKVSTWNKECK